MISEHLLLLFLAAIVSNGKSEINRIYHLDRGYEKIENKLKKIGVKIKRLKIVNKYLAKIIAYDQEGLQMISACSSGEQKLKYLISNIFLQTRFF